MNAEFLPATGMPPSIELIPPGRLMIDDSYQRAITSQASQTLINRIARSWDWRLCVPLLVSRRDHGLYVIDGQHRLASAIKRGDIMYLPCCVSQYDTPAEEASIFVAANRKRRSVGRLDTFRAALLAGDPDAVAIHEIVAGAGLLMSEAPRNNLPIGEINALVSLTTCIKRHGEAVTFDSLCLLAKAFRGQVLAYSGQMLGALASLQPGERSGLQYVLERRSLTDWIDAARVDPQFVNGGEGAKLALRRAIRADVSSAQPTSPQAHIRPVADSREACRRCGTRGDVGCDHQRAFGTPE